MNMHNYPSNPSCHILIPHDNGRFDARQWENVLATWRIGMMPMLARL